MTPKKESPRGTSAVDVHAVDEGVVDERVEAVSEEHGVIIVGEEHGVVSNGEQGVAVLEVEVVVGQAVETLRGCGMIS